jgi:DeoR/GlpR family transcriptional regulator of sugar metabolism
MAARKKAMHEATAPVDAPLPLVTVDNHGKFVIGTDAINLIRQIKGDIAVVSVAGIYRYANSLC